MAAPLFNTPEFFSEIFISVYLLLLNRFSINILILTIIYAKLFR